MVETSCIRNLAFNLLVPANLDSLIFTSSWYFRFEHLILVLRLNLLLIFQWIQIHQVLTPGIGWTGKYDYSLVPLIFISFFDNLWQLYFYFLFLSLLSCIPSLTDTRSPSLPLPLIPSHHITTVSFPPLHHCCLLCPLSRTLTVLLSPPEGNCLLFCLLLDSLFQMSLRTGTKPSYQKCSSIVSCSYLLDLGQWILKWSNIQMSLSISDISPQDKPRFN